MDGGPAARAWLLDRIDRRTTEALQSLLRRMTEDLALATAESATLRRLSADGHLLLPVAADHPDPALRAAMLANAHRTEQTTGSGLWRPVIAECRPMRWHIPPGAVPAEASTPQAEHMERYPVRAVLAAPLVTPQRELVGGVSLVRYVVDRPFTDDDEALLLAFAARAALVMQHVRALEALGDA